MASCAENVLIGLNPREDGGVLDGGAFAGGGSAGGAVDAGGGSGGNGAGGTADSGAGGGSADAGPGGGTTAGGAGGGAAGGSDGGPDAAVPDAGVPDASVPDAAVPDGGPPLLLVEGRVPLCAEPSEALTFEVFVENVGGSRSSTVAGVVEIPTAFTIQSVSGCAPMGFRADASVWACDAGSVAALSRSTAAQFRLLAPSVGGSYTHRAALGTDAGWSGLTAVTGIGAVAVDPTVGGNWDAGACQGVNVTSISMCMPGDLVYDTLQFLPDASVVSPDGIPATWSQSPTRRNLCFQSFGPLGGNIFRGESLNARCFGGLTDRWVTGEINFAAWIACH